MARKREVVRMELEELKKLVDVVAALRDPEKGCPWDLAQNHNSLLKHLHEEAYEFAAAVEKGDIGAIEEELGDVFLQVLLHAQIAGEAGRFDLESLSRSLREKLVRRHPHVFGTAPRALSAEEALDNWRQAKESEGKPRYKITERELMAPALRSAGRLGEKAAGLNFDWEGPMQVSYKVEEEWQELKEEIVRGGDRQRIEEEMGDFLFSCAQLARHLGLDPEESLVRANAKFIRRFNQIEDKLADDDLDFKDLDTEALDRYWDAVKDDESHA